MTLPAAHLPPPHPRPSSFTLRGERNDALSFQVPRSTTRADYARITLSGFSPLSNPSTRTHARTHAHTHTLAYVPLLAAPQVRTLPCTPTSSPTYCRPARRASHLRIRETCSAAFRAESPASPEESALCGWRQALPWCGRKHAQSSFRAALEGRAAGQRCTFAGEEFPF